MIYLVYRVGVIDDKDKSNVLAAVVTGAAIDDVTRELQREVCDDLYGDIEHNFADAAAYEQTPVSWAKGYDYMITGVGYPATGEENTVVDYGLVEENEYQKGERHR